MNSLIYTSFPKRDIVPYSTYNKELLNGICTNKISDYIFKQAPRTLLMIHNNYINRLDHLLKIENKKYFYQPIMHYD